MASNKFLSLHPCGVVLAGYQKMRILLLRFLFHCFLYTYIFWENST